MQLRARYFQLNALAPKIALCFFAAILFSACSIRLISNYDEQTDKSVTDLQKKFETFFVKLEGLQTYPECSYEKNKAFYDEAKVDVSVIQVRATAIPRNEITSQQFDQLSVSLNDLEKLHKHKDDKYKDDMKKGGKELVDDNKKKGAYCLTPDELKPDRQAFTSSFTAILKLELAKKRGESK